MIRSLILGVKGERMKWGKMRKEVRGVLERNRIKIEILNKNCSITLKGK